MTSDIIYTNHYKRQFILSPSLILSFKVHQPIHYPKWSPLTDVSPENIF